MDRRRIHHHNHNQIDPRFIPLRPQHQHQPSLFHPPPPPPPPPTQGRFPAPPQQSSLCPALACFLHNPPLSRRHEGNFVNLPHHLQSLRHHGNLVDQSRHYHHPRPPRVVFDDDRGCIRLPDPPRVGDLDMKIDMNYDHCGSGPIHRPINFDRTVKIDDVDDDRFRSSPRFREGLSFKNPNSPRFYPIDEFRGRRDDRRVVEIDDQRYRHEQYRPDVLLSEFELNPGSNQCVVQGPVVDEVPIRVSRDEVNVRRVVQTRSRDVSHSRVTFRNRGIDIDDGLYEKGMNSPGSEPGKYIDVDGERREEIQDYSHSGSSNGSLRKISQKKSAFLRIQPLKHSSSSWSSRFDTTPSPRKGKAKDKDKGKDKESSEYLNHKSSQDRGASPLELDVSFKSNVLVAKAIVGNLSTSPSDRNVNLSASDLDGTRIGGSESPLRKESVKCEKSPSLFRKEVTDLEKKVIRPVMKRVGPSNNADSLKGSVSKGSLEVEVQNSDKKGDKLPASNSRKRKKSIVRPSRLSGSVLAKMNAVSLIMDTSQNQPSSSVSDKCIKKSDKEGSSDDQIFGSANKETIEQTVKFDLNETPNGVEGGVVDNFDSEASCPKKLRKRESSSELRAIDGSENSNGIGEEVKITSDSNKDVTKSVEKCSSDIGIECNSSKDQNLVSLLVDCGSREGSPEPVACLEGNLDTIDVNSEEINMHNSVVVANATSSSFDVSNRAQERNKETCTPDKLCETKVVLSSEISVAEIRFDGLHLDEVNNQSESLNSEELTNLAKVSKFGVDNHETKTTVNNVGLVSVDSEILTPFSDINPTNDTEEQECQGTGTSAVEESREVASMASDLLGSTFPSFSLEKDVFLPNRKRKVVRKLDSLNSGVPASWCGRAVNVPVKDSDSVEKMSPAISSFPCVIVESNVLHSNELIENLQDSIFSTNHGCDSDPSECDSSCSKKQKILSLESVPLDGLPSEKCDIPAPANTLVSIIEVPMGFVKNSSLPAVVAGLPNCVHTNMNVTDEGTDNLLTCNFVDNSKADFLLEESSLTMEEIAHPDDKQSSFYSESGKQQDILNINMSEFGDGSRSVAVESEDRMATDHPNGSVPYLRPEIPRNSDNETPVIDMECENNIISNDVSSSLSDSPQLCAESAYDGLTENSTKLETPGNVGSSGAECLGAPTANTSDVVSAVNALPEMKGNIDDKGSSSMPSSIANSLVECNKINLKPGVSSSKRNQPFVPKTLVVPSKNANITISSSNVLSRRHVGRTSYTGHASSVMPTSTKAPSAYPAKPRTWCRFDNAPASNTLVKKSSVSSAPSQKPPIDRTVKFRSSSYIRKGNSLVRNPVPTATTLGPHVFGVSYNQSKPNETNKISKIGSSGVIDSMVVYDTPSMGGQNTSIEMPKTPPLPCSDKASNCDVPHSEDCTFSPPVVSEGLDSAEALRSFALHFSRNSTVVGNRHVEDAGALSDGNLPGLSAKRVVYIKRKSNQLIAATNSPDPSVSKVGMTPTLSCDRSYYKRKKNQLIRASSESNIHQMVAVIDDSSTSRPQMTSHSYVGRSSTKKRSNKVKPAKVSLVWKLGDRNSSDKGSDLLVCGKLLSHLLPWKRATYWMSVRLSSGNMPNCFSVKNQKLLSSRRTLVYVRSGRGFSLRRSKVISVAGSSLKWSKSMERRSKKVDEEVANAVAAARKNMAASNVRAESTHHSSHKPGERIFRIGVYRYRMDCSRRTLHRIPDEESTDSFASKPAKDVWKTYVPKRLLIGSDEYVRIGNGNQLVRDPKRRTRILASEKIRWSLHTARTRLAKKRKFCQFFPRFGKCNKGEGKCHFVHDPSKIAVCTKFLNGLCSDPNCKLTHKVIPERMPDCSFFLQGLCSNKNCPYRHVNVNPKASICESFLRGYCAEGNECRKKHSYSCPEYKASGSCPEGSQCKLYHPRKGKSQKRKASKDRRNSRRRYFGSGNTTTSRLQTMTEKLAVASKNDCSDCEGVDLGDFISLDVSDDEVEESQDATCTTMDVLEGRGSKSQLDDDDKLITPFRLLVRP